MCPIKRSQILLGIALVLSCSVGVSWAEEVDKKLVEQGKKVYTRACAGCHGADGKGKGDQLILDSIRPRDFTIGVFKYRSTATGQLPTAADIERTVTKGVRNTNMPHHAVMSAEDRHAVAVYTKTFFAQWQNGHVAEIVTLPPMPKYVGSGSSVARGKEVFKILRCDSCHGPEGKANGLPADITGNPQIAIDFAAGGNSFKGGGRPEDIYRALVTGLDGSKMSSYRQILHEPDGEIIRDGDGWHLVYYLIELRNQSSE